MQRGKCVEAAGTPGSSVGLSARCQECPVLMLLSCFPLLNHYQELPWQDPEPLPALFLMLVWYCDHAVRDMGESAGALAALGYFAEGWGQ